MATNQIWIYESRPVDLQQVLEHLFEDSEKIEIGPIRSLSHGQEFDLHTSSYTMTFSNEINSHGSGDCRHEMSYQMPIMMMNFAEYTQRQMQGICQRIEFFNYRQREMGNFLAELNVEKNHDGNHLNLIQWKDWSQRLWNLRSELK